MVAYSIFLNFVEVFTLTTFVYLYYSFSSRKQFCLLLTSLFLICELCDILRENGTRAGMPFVRHLDGELWELRPLKDRILFFAYNGNDIILLSKFHKKTQKTPLREIKKANKLMKDYLERSNENE